MGAVKRAVLNLRTPLDLKRRVEEYARVRGISVNAAGALLLDEGLRAEAERRR